MLCPCGNRSIGKQLNGKPFCLKCVEGNTPKEIMDRMPEIKDKEFIEYLKTLGINDE